MLNQFYKNILKQPSISTPQTENWLHLLQAPDARQLVIDAIYGLFVRWHLHPINQATLLGLSDMSELNQHVSSEEIPQVFIHIGHLLAIDRSLLQRYPYQADNRQQWIWQPLARLHNLTPLSIMLTEGLEGIKYIRFVLETTPEPIAIVSM